MQTCTKKISKKRIKTMSSLIFWVYLGLFGLGKRFSYVWGIVFHLLCPIFVWRYVTWGDLILSSWQAKHSKARVERRRNCRINNAHYYTKENKKQGGTLLRWCRIRQRFCPSSFKSNNIQFEHTVYLKFLSVFFFGYTHTSRHTFLSLSQYPHVGTLPDSSSSLPHCNVDPPCLPPTSEELLYRPLSKDIHFLGASLQTDINRKQKEILRTRHVLPRLVSRERPHTRVLPDFLCNCHSRLVALVETRGVIVVCGLPILFVRGRKREGEG